MRRNFTALACLALAALGLAAAMLASPAARADGAVYYKDLPSMGYTLTVIGDVTHTPVCLNVWASGNGAPPTNLGDPDDQHGCNTYAFFAAQVAQLIASYPPLPATVSTPAATTTVAPVDTAPAPAAAAPAAEPAPAAAAPAQTVTVTTTVVLTDPTVDARLSALEQRQQVNDARIATLELKAGIIVPEAKNEPPFTNPV